MMKEDEAFQGKLLKTFHLGTPGAIVAAAASYSGSFVASCSTNKKVLLWETASGRCVGSLDGHMADISSCSFSNDLLVTGSRDGMIYLWKYKELKRCSKIDVHAGPVHSCVLSPNGRYLASSSEDKTVRVYTIRTAEGEYIQGPQCKELRGHTDGVNSVHFSTDSCAIVSAASDGIIKVWDTETGECLVTLKGEGKITHANFSANDRHIVTLTRKAVTVYSVSKGTEAWKIEEEGGFQALSCHPTENIFIVVSMDGKMSCYDLKKRAEIFKKGTDHRGPVLTCSFSLSGKFAVTGGIDGKVLAWE